jgi:hypothetical protein
VNCPSIAPPRERCAAWPHGCLPSEIVSERWSTSLCWPGSFWRRSSPPAPRSLHPIAAALKLDHDAIYGDLVATKYSDAEIKIKQALTMCNKAACSSKVRAQLHRDLGIVYVAGSKETNESKRSSPKRSDWIPISASSRS